MSEISTEELPKKFIDVLGHRMAYVEMGTGDPIVFQHGNPTSSYLWRNVMPHVSDFGRCIAIDLIGMGDSEKLSPSGPDRYRYVEHRRFFDAALETLGACERVTFVVHDWGSALGFDWARRHSERVKAIAYMEGIVMPLRMADWPDNIRSVFQAFRSAAGEEMVLEKNFFVDTVLPNGVLRGLTDAEMEVYRRPFKNNGEDRRPTLTWPREIPFDGEPADVHRIVEQYSKWMAENSLPKLFVDSDPGVILTGRQREFCRSWKNQTEVLVEGSHFIQEDSPHEIGKAVADWLADIN